MESKEPNKRGRKPQWTQEKVELMCKAIAAGKSYKDAYTAARISHTTFHRHLKEDNEFIALVKKAEAEYQQWYDSHLVVECKRSLIELVCGYEWDEVTTESALNKDGKMVEVKKKIVHKKTAPSATAIIFALCNRDPEHWQNRINNELSGKLTTESTNNGITLENVPDSLLAQVIEAIKKK